MGLGAGVRLWLGAEVRAPAWRLPLSGGKQTFVLDVRFSADYVRFGPKSGRIDTVTVESARDPSGHSVEYAVQQVGTENQGFAYTFK